MKHFSILMLTIALLALSHTIQAQIIAQQNFNTLNDSTSTGNKLPSGSLLTNGGSKNIGGPGLDFSTTWFDTRGVTLGPVTPTGDASDFIGVNSFSGSNAPDVAADGTAVAFRVEQNFEFNDTDGAAVLKFEAVDVSGFTNRRLSLNYWINNVGYESDDAFTISLSNGGLGIVLLGFGETELEGNAETGEANASSWRSLVVDLDAVLSSSGLNPANLILSIAVDVNSSDENIFVDDIVFEAIPTLPCSISSLTWHTLPCDDNDTGVPDDDTFIADFTTTFTNPPTTGNIELIVGGQTYSTSVGGLGTQFQFLSIPLPANGQPVDATIRFTAEPSCSLTTTVGTAPQPCSVISACSELFISEYVEGSGLNKCIEIYNPTGVDVDLGAYGISLFFNGSFSASEIALTGVIPSGGVHVICNPSASASARTYANQTSGSILFNGNDVVILRSPEGIIDAIGQLGDASNFGVDVTLRRKASVQNGDSNPYDAFSAATEWDAFPVNDFSGLGFHSTGCTPDLPNGAAETLVGDCTTGGSTYYFAFDRLEMESSCYGSPGQDEMTFVHNTLCGDGEVIAQLQDLDQYAFAGVIMRESTAPGARQVWLYRKGGSNLAFWETRTTNNSTPLIKSRLTASQYTWMRITRQGNAFRGYVSSNGSSWVQLFFSYLPMNACMEVGLALHSYNDLSLVSAVFSDFQINGGTPTREAGTDELAGAEWLDNLAAEAVGERSFPAIPETDRPANLALFPNPAADVLNVVLPADATDGEPLLIRIMDMNGKLIFTDRLDRYDTMLPLDLNAMGLSPGVYQLSVQTNDALLTERFVKAD